MRGVLTPKEGTVEIQEVEDPCIVEPTDVIIKVSIAAICGSDLHIINRHIPKVNPKIVLGHEFVGTIVEVGKAVKNFRIGERVIGPPAYWCGHCDYCRRNLPQYCKEGGVYGYTTHGAQAEYMRVLYADNCLSKVPDEIEDEEAVLIGDVFQTGFHAAYQGEILPGDTVAVFGCGPIGLGAILSCWFFGAKEVFAIDVIPKRLDLAQKFGAHPVDASRQDPVALIKELTFGEGVDVAIEAVGTSQTLLAALKAIKRGGRVSVVGIFGNQVEIPVNKYSQYGVTIKMGLGYLGWTPRLIDLVKTKKIPLASLISHRFSLIEAPLAYQFYQVHKEDCLKIILKL